MMRRKQSIGLANRVDLRGQPWGGLGEGVMPSGIEYYERVLATRTGNLLAYWPLWEMAGLVADNIQGIAARDAAIDATLILGEPGIGDGNTSIRDDLLGWVNFYTISLRAAFRGDEGTMMVWCRPNEAWAAANSRFLMSIGCNDANRIYMRKSGANTVHLLGSFGGAVSQRSVGGMVTLDFFNLAVTWSAIAGQIIFYVAGVPAAPNANACNWNSVTCPLAANRCGIGGYINANNPWNGWMAHGAIWDAPLTPEEIAALAVV